MTSARIFIHPRCMSGVASAALAACMQEHGYDLSKIAVLPSGKVSEFARIISVEGDIMNCERLDGTRFSHNVGSPEAA